MLAYYFRLCQGKEKQGSFVLGWNIGFLVLIDDNIPLYHLFRVSTGIVHLPWCCLLKNKYIKCVKPLLVC